MFLITLKEKIVIVSGGETFYGKLLVANDINRTGTDHHNADVVGFLSILNDTPRYNTFRGNKAESVNLLEDNIMSVQLAADLKGVSV